MSFHRNVTYFDKVNNSIRFLSYLDANKKHENFLSLVNHFILSGYLIRRIKNNVSFKIQIQNLLISGLHTSIKLQLFFSCIFTEVKCRAIGNKRLQCITKVHFAMTTRKSQLSVSYAKDTTNNGSIIQQWKFYFNMTVFQVKYVNLYSTILVANHTSSLLIWVNDTYVSE